MHSFFDLTYFREVGQKYRNIFVLVQMKTSKSHSEINWPLAAQTRGWKKYLFKKFGLTEVDQSVFKGGPEDNIWKVPISLKIDFCCEIAIDFFFLGGKIYSLTWFTQSISDAVKETKGRSIGQTPFTIHAIPSYKKWWSILMGPFVKFSLILDGFCFLFFQF